MNSQSYSQWLFDSTVFIGFLQHFLLIYFTQLILLIKMFEYHLIFLPILSFINKAIHIYDNVIHGLDTEGI